MISFIEHPHTGYALRTYTNCKESQLTIAFATDFSTAGEVLTRKASYGAGCAYVAVELYKLRTMQSDLEKVRVAIAKNGYHKLHIAGNGIYTLKESGITQQNIDDFIFNFMELVIDKIQLRDDWVIRTGGQTGVDESGTKFADEQKVNDNICCFPKGWMFRNEKGWDIKSALEFKARFGTEYDVRDLI